VLSVVRAVLLLALHPVLAQLLVALVLALMQVQV
jgi:hypothetical protein